MERPGGSEQAAQGELSRRNFLIAAGTAIGTGLLANACTTGPNWPDGPEVAPDILVDGREINGPVDLLREGNWKPLAGAQVTAQGLELSPTGMSFVDKRDGDKKTFVPNPPLNMLGMRLQAAGDFALQAQISSQTPTSFQLYRKLPRRYDDCRVETSRVEC